MPKRTNPFEEIQRLFDRMAEQFEDFDDWGAFEAAMPGRISLDVAEYDDEFVVTADLPGYERDDIDVELSDDRLRIAADHEEDTEAEEPGRYVRRERRKRSMSRTITLPEPVDDEAVSATFRHGVLTITLGKAAEADSHTIDIE